MSSWLEAQLNKYGVITRSVPLGQQELGGKTLEYPPAILGRIGDDASKKTVLIYGHFDVQPVSTHDRSLLSSTPQAMQNLLIEYGF